MLNKKCSGLVTLLFLIYLPNRLLINNTKHFIKFSLLEIKRVKLPRLSLSRVFRNVVLTEIVKDTLASVDILFEFSLSHDYYSATDHVG